MQEHNHFKSKKMRITARANVADLAWLCCCIEIEAKQRKPVSNKHTKSKNIPNKTQKNKTNTQKRKKKKNMLKTAKEHDEIYSFTNKKHAK